MRLLYSFMSTLPSLLLGGNPLHLSTTLPYDFTTKALSIVPIMSTRPEQSKIGSGTLDPALFPRQIEYLPDYRILFCHVHK
jgi:hypothetical protein